MKPRVKTITPRIRGNAIATRNGRPAHLGAPERLRQSHVERPTMPVVQAPGFFARLFGARP